MRYLLSLIALLTLITIPSFKPKRPYPIKQIQEQYRQNLNIFTTTLTLLPHITNNWNNSPEANTHLQKHISTLRFAYKRIEFLLATLDPQAHNMHLNGAPLPKLIPNTPQIAIQQPTGLQRLDEWAHEPHSIQDKDELIRLTKELTLHATETIAFQSKVTLTDRLLFAAARLELIRIFTLGLTGFDTPGSLQAIPEAQIALQSINSAVGQYHKPLKSLNPTLAKQLQATFKQAIKTLTKANDFNTFDRLEFLTKYINPLYNLLLQAQQTLQIELPEETPNYRSPINYSATNLLANNFLDPFFFINQTKAQQKPETIRLGKLLFFDPILSSNIKHSCASCHDPKRAFTDGLPKSRSLTDSSSLNRNTPTLINALYATRFFHDLRTNRLEEQIDHVIYSSQEFQTTYAEIFKRLEQSQEYTNLFEQAFPYARKKISKYTLTTAIAAYIQNLHAFQSPFDQFVRNEIPSIKDSIRKGFNLFMGKAACGTCHFLPTFAGLVPPEFRETESEVLGVPQSPDSLNPILDPDLGRFANGRPKEQAPFYKHAFKTPTLRNIAQTAPYMHNGVYNTLEEVMDFYNKGGGQGLGINIPNQTLPPDSLQLSQTEIANIIAFMKALSNNPPPATIPKKLPKFEQHPQWNNRNVGGIMY